MVGGMKGCMVAAAAAIKGGFTAVVDTSRLQRCSHSIFVDIADF